MSASLVGSEMCIRDRGTAARAAVAWRSHLEGECLHGVGTQGLTRHKCRGCLLYTSDAADDM
eukprot:6838515-Alexandrium_andersonii.AAC.1